MAIPEIRDQLRAAETFVSESLTAPSVSLRMQALHNRFHAAGEAEREAMALVALSRLAMLDGAAGKPTA